MTMKKKVVTTTLAATVAATLLAGLPISGVNSLAGKAGLVGIASASSKDDLQVKLNALYSNLGTGEANVKALYDALKNVDNSEAAAPLIAKFDSLGLNDQEKQALADLFEATGILLFLPPNLDNLTALLDDDAVAPVIDKLEADNDGLDIKVEDLAQFSLSLLDTTKTLIGSSSFSINDITDSVKRNALLNSILSSSTVSGNSLYQTLLTKYFGGSSNELVDVLTEVYNNYKVALDETNTHLIQRAVTNLASAYYAVYFPVTSSPAPSNTDTSSGPVTIDQALNAIADLKGKLADATAEEKDKLIKEVVAKASSAIANAAKLDLTSLTQKDGNKTTVTVTASAVADVLKGIQSIKDALKDAIGSTDGLTLPPLTIDLGTSDSTEAKVGLASDVLAQVIAAGFATVEIAQNGLSAALPLSGEFTKGIDFSINRETATPEKTGGLPVASDIYNFSLNLDGKPAEAFDEPIVIKFPIRNADGLDRELLTVARIEDNGTLSFQGGDLVGDALVEPRYHFSSYVVLENKVSFNDISKVQDWAGRQIVAIAAKGAIQGKAPGQFAPNDSITRAEFAKILVTALNLDNDGATTDKFTDVKANDWFAPYVAVAEAKGIINGRTATTFDPSATITRAELSTMIARALRSVKGVKDADNIEAALSKFSDASSISSSLRAGVALAASNNIVLGINGKFAPNDNATRAQAAVMIYRAIHTEA